MMHLARAFQVVEGFGDLLRVGQRVGAVQHEQVEVIGFQALEDGVHRAQDVGFGMVVSNGVSVARFNAAF